MPITKYPNERQKIINEILIARPNGLSITELTSLVNNRLANKAPYNELPKEVTTRTIRNDIEAMMADFGVEIKNKKGVWFYADEDQTIDPIKISNKDKQAIGFAIEVLHKYQGTSLKAKFSKILEKILSNTVLDNLLSNRYKYSIQSSDAVQVSGIQWLEPIYEAITDKRTLSIQYKNFDGRISERIISPYLLREYRNRWYLIAYVHDISKKEKVLLHKLSRIEQVSESYDNYADDVSFNPEKYFKYSLGVFHRHGAEPIKITFKIFDKGILKLFQEDPIHHSQIIKQANESDAFLTIEVFDTPELENMILSWGEHIAVIEPLDLRDRILSRLRSQVARYQSS